MNRKLNLPLYGSLLIGMGVGGYELLHHLHASSTAPDRAGASALSDSTAGDRKPLYWYDPMYPNQHFDHSGKSPFMDMQLVPRMPVADASHGGSNAGAIAIDPRVVQNLGVRLASVEQGQFARVVDTVGTVAIDERRIEAVQVRAPGWVEQLAVRAVGDPVRRGQLLASVYSPDLFAAQQEFVIALGSADANLVRAARERLALFGLSESQIARVEKTRQAERRINYYAPIDGYVMELGVRQGAAVQPGTMLFQLAGLDTVWVNVDVPETQTAWIRTGDHARTEVPALPGERFEGVVDYLYPELTAATRTLKLRLVIKNAGQHLRPGMFASVHLLGAPGEQVLMVPTEAVIKTGERSVVVIADDASHFHAVLVQVGAEQAGKSEIVEGLSPGQRVVASGQFLIDSEASLHGAFDSLAGPGGGPATAADPGLMPAPGEAR